MQTETEKEHSLLDSQTPGHDDEEEGLEELKIPDLEGDMLFSLEDPLDEEHGPDVDIESPDDLVYDKEKEK